MTHLLFIWWMVRLPPGTRLGTEWGGSRLRGLVEGQTLDHVTLGVCTPRHTHRNTHTILGIAVLGNKILPEDSGRVFWGKKYVCWNLREEQEWARREWRSHSSSSSVRGAYSQKSRVSKPQPTDQSAPAPWLVTIKFYWNTASSMCSCIVCGCFCARTARVNRYNRDPVGHWDGNVYYLALYRQSLRNQLWERGTMREDLGMEGLRWGRSRRNLKATPRSLVLSWAQGELGRFWGRPEGD